MRAALLLLLVCLLLNCMAPLSASAQSIALCLEPTSSGLTETVRIELGARGYAVTEGCAEHEARVGVEVPDPLGAFYVWAEAPDGARRTARVEGPFDRADGRVLALAIVSLLEEPAVEPPSVTREAHVEPHAESVSDRLDAPADPAVPAPPAAVDTSEPLEAVESSRIIEPEIGVQLALTGAFSDERGGLGGMVSMHAPLSPWLRFRGELAVDVAPDAFVDGGVAAGFEALISIERERSWLAFGLEGRMQMRVPTTSAYPLHLAFGPGATASYLHAIAEDWSVFARIGGAPIFVAIGEGAPGYRLYAAIGFSFR